MDFSLEYDEFSQDGPAGANLTADQVLAAYRDLSPAEQDAFALRAGIVADAKPLPRAERSKILRQLKPIPDEPTPAQIISLWRHGRIPRESISRQQRSQIMKEIAAQRRSKPTGRPATVPHNPGPRGGCRCANCRRAARSSPKP